MVWKNLKLIWHTFETSTTFVFFIFVSTQRGHNMLECLLVSPHSHKLLTEFNFIQFCRHFNIKKYLKSFKVLFFFYVIFPLLMYVFKKACSNLTRECEINDNNRKKLDESWTRPTFQQLNEWGKYCQIFQNTLSNFYISI